MCGGVERCLLVSWCCERENAGTTSWFLSGNNIMTWNPTTSSYTEARVTIQISNTADRCQQFTLMCRECVQAERYEISWNKTGLCMLIKTKNVVAKTRNIWEIKIKMCKRSESSKSSVYSGSQLTSLDLNLTNWISLRSELSSDHVTSLQRLCSPDYWSSALILYRLISPNSPSRFQWCVGQFCYSRFSISLVVFFAWCRSIIWLLWNRETS